VAEVTFQHSAQGALYIHLFQTDPVHAAASEASNHSSEVSAGLNYRDSKRWMHEQRARLGVSVDKLKKLASGRPARQMRHVRFT
jgi:hypothetical protein